MKKIIKSGALIVAVAALAAGLTMSYFSDKEKSEGNTFTAGAIDLKVDSEAHYNGNVCDDGQWTGDAAYPTGECGLTWGQPDGEDIVAQKFFDFADLKPGDFGENTISLHVDNNDAYMCAQIDITADDDVSCTTPEDDAEEACSTDTGVYNGDIAKNLSLAWWADDGNNALDDNEVDSLFFQSGMSLGDILTGVGGHSLYLTLADASDNFFTGNANDPITGDETKYVGLAWCFGDMTIDGTTISCDGSSVNNEAQTDMLTADLSFSVVQARHNDDFECPDSFRPSNQLPDADVSTGGGWSPNASSDIQQWFAKARSNNNNFEVELGNTGNSSTAEAVWENGVSEHFTLEYDDATGDVTFAIDGETPVVKNLPVTATSRIGITVKSLADGTTLVDNLSLNIANLGTTSVSTLPSPSYLLIDGIDLSNDFVLEGDFTFNWVSQPSQEAQAMQISID